MKRPIIRTILLRAFALAILTTATVAARAGDVDFDVADVEWVRPVTRSVAVPIAETVCDAQDEDVAAPNGDIRIDHPDISLADAIRLETIRAPARPRCRLMKRTHYRDEIVAYRVRYRYAGEDYERQLSYDPGEQLRVRVEVSAGPDNR